MKKQGYISILGMMLFFSMSGLASAQGMIQELTIESNGGLAVNIQDQTTQVIDLHAHRNIAELTLVQNTTINTNTVVIAHNATVAVGQVICFKEDGRFSQAEVISIAADTPVAGQDTLSLDTPMDYPYTINAESVHNGDFNLNVNGDVTPVAFHISPPNNTEWDVVRMIIQIEDGTAMDSSKFGGLPALTKGVIMRKKDGTYYNLFNAKSNSDFAVHAYDISYDDKAPAGVFGVRTRRTFGGQSKNGVVVRLDGSAGDEFQAIIQDDLTGLTKFHLVVQGHIVTN